VSLHPKKVLFSFKLILLAFKLTVVASVLLSPFATPLSVHLVPSSVPPALFGTCGYLGHNIYERSQNKGSPLQSQQEATTVSKLHSFSTF